MHGSRREAHAPYRLPPPPEFRLFRRVNVLLYLNPAWRPGDGGELVLFDFDDGHPIVIVPPRFGTCVIFATDHRSVHGVEPLTASARRCSIALFYYTVDDVDVFSGDRRAYWYPPTTWEGRDLAVRARSKAKKTALGMAKALTHAAYRVDPQKSNLVYAGHLAAEARVWVACRLDWLHAARGPGFGFRDHPEGHARRRPSGGGRAHRTGPVRGLDRAQDAGVATSWSTARRTEASGLDFDRDGFTISVAAALVAHQVDLVAMAGFGTVLAESAHDAFSGRILNTHPALLPAFPGWHAVQDALTAGVTETGCTVHLATLEMDAGPILAQEVVPVRAGDSEETLHERIKVVERSLYPATVAWALGELEKGREIRPRERSPDAGAVKRENDRAVVLGAVVRARLRQRRAWPSSPKDSWISAGS